MKKLVSFDLKADFGFLRKPDTNDGISMSYNMLHKPGLLGILGAILGLRGYHVRGELPEYYQKLKDLQVGIAPIGDSNGNFAKITIIYTNTIGYANKDGNFIAYENTIIKPSYRVFIALFENDTLFQYLKNGIAEYIPYLGKNEYPVWWENFQVLDLQPFKYQNKYKVKSLFTKPEELNIRSQEAQNQPFTLRSDPSSYYNSFFYFERLPTRFQEFETKRGKEYQYFLSPFVYSNAVFSTDYILENSYMISDNEVVQLG